MHEMSEPIFWKIRKNFKMSSAEIFIQHAEHKHCTTIKFAFDG